MKRKGSYEFFDIEVTTRRAGDFSMVGLPQAEEVYDPKGMTVDVFLNHIAELPKDLSNVNFCANRLIRSNPNILSSIFTSLESKPNIKEIDLSYNALGRLPFSELLAIAKQIPDHIELVHFNGNQFNQLDSAQCKAFMEVISSKGQKISLDDDELANFSSILTESFSKSIQTDTFEEENESSKLTSP